MPIYGNIGGSQKKLSSLYANIGGAQKAMNNVYANIDGGQKEIYNTVKPITPSTLQKGQHFYMNDPQMNMAEYVCMEKSVVGGNWDIVVVGVARVHVLNNPITNSTTLKNILSEYRYSIREGDIPPIINNAVSDTNAAYFNWIKQYSIGCNKYISETYDGKGYTQNEYGSWYYYEPEIQPISSDNGLYVFPFNVGIWAGDSDFYMYFGVQYLDTHQVGIPDTKDNGVAVNSFTGNYSYCLKEYSSPYRAKICLEYRDLNDNVDSYNTESTTDVYIKPYVLFNVNNMPTIYVKE